MICVICGGPTPGKRKTCGDECLQARMQVVGQRGGRRTAPRGHGLNVGKYDPQRERVVDE